jgi:hypothetical protein
MDYVKQLKAIVSNKSWNKKEKIDQLLKLDCSMYTYLGIDSTSEEIKYTKDVSLKIYQAVSSLDEDVGKLLLLDR